MSARFRLPDKLCQIYHKSFFYKKIVYSQLFMTHLFMCNVRKICNKNVVLHIKYRNFPWCSEQCFFSRSFMEAEINHVFIMFCWTIGLIKSLSYQSENAIKIVWSRLAYRSVFRWKWREIQIKFNWNKNSKNQRISTLKKLDHMSATPLQKTHTFHIKC